MLACADEDPDVLCSGRERFSHPIHNRFGLRGAIGTKGQCGAGPRHRILGGDDGSIGDFGACRVRSGGKHLRERLVDPVDDRARRSEVASELHRFHRNIAHRMLLLRREKDADLGFAKAIDRLHRVADREQRAAVTGREAGGQSLDQLELR